MNIRGMTTFGESGEHGHHCVTNYGSVKVIGQVGLNDMGIVIVSDDNILIKLTGSDRIAAC